MKVTNKGQVTIPIAIREKFGIRPDMDIDFVEREGQLVVVVDPAQRKEAARRMIERMRGSATTGLSTDEIMALTRGEDDGSILV